MPGFKYKFQMYQALHARMPEIYAEAQRAADEIGLLGELRGKVGLSGAVAGFPAPRRDDAWRLAGPAREAVPVGHLVEEIREVVKDGYGDSYDGCPVSTGEAGLRVAYQVLFTPALSVPGSPYRARYLALGEKHMHRQGAYGRPFPPKWAVYLGDRGVTPGELGSHPEYLADLDVVLAPLAGARYENHGIKYGPVPMLLGVDPEASLDRMVDLCQDHAALLTGITSLGYDTPGYGYGGKDEEGTPRLQKFMGQLAAEMNIPYVVDNAWGLPFVGADPRRTGADVMVYAMESAGGAGGALIIGGEEVMVGVRRALGMDASRRDGPACPGSASYVTYDPGREALLTQVQVLRALRERPRLFTDPVDQLYDLVREELRALPSKLLEKLVISRSYNSATVEINYERTWEGGALGFPIFTAEDTYSGSHIIQSGLSRMGIIPSICHDGNLFLSPGPGTSEPDGALHADHARLVIRGLLRLLEIVGKYSGYFA